ncbi:DUF4365 domain-containing protein [Actinocorallia sp. API 0066]|uniref:DUF4365 domain-containing protein n=1 Tax=Actinocorallia sp. API 0066 TaxID=2896846 RepID=UPI001E2D1409|nr:DUF4365 domain-containing protein [Actinocorallia sp. API 0066]MCD0450083.1 DUF4365 domain-containing protein [Actinocorallia sp. API 0066]
MRIPESRDVERAGVNAFRALFERHAHLVHEVDGRNDYGDDLHVTFTADREPTGDMIRVQVKSGTSYRRRGGYGVPVEGHGRFWADGNVPVVCVVYDPETSRLHWANATRALHAARRENLELRTITVPADEVLDDETIAEFVTATRHYVGRYRGNQVIRVRLGEMAGTEFAPSDLVHHFVNWYGEDLVFRQCRGEGYATLLHSDLDWEPQYIGPEMLRPDARAMLGEPSAGGVILNSVEMLWLTACFAATEWARHPTEGERVRTRPEVRDGWVRQRIGQRLFVEPDAVTDSMAFLRRTGGDRPEEIAKLEADPGVVAEAAAVTWRSWPGTSTDAQRLATFCLVEDVVCGAPSLPLGEQFRIRWRTRKRVGEWGFDARVGAPSGTLTTRRERVRAKNLTAGDRVYWLSRDGNERGRTVSAVWASDETPGAVCVQFDALTMGDTFWPYENFVRARRSR